MTSRLEELKYNWANDYKYYLTRDQLNELIELLIKENDELYNLLERQEQGLDRRKI